MSLETKTKNNYFSNIKFDVDNVSFDLSNVDTSLANSFRRTILSEIPTYGFEDESDKTFSHYLDIGLKLPESVKVLENTSSLHNEFLSHRVGLIPVCSTRPVTTSFNETLMRRIFHPYVDNDKVKELQESIKHLDESTKEGHDEILSTQKQLNRYLETPLFNLSIKNTSVNRNKIKDGSLFNVWGRDVEPKKIRDDNSIDVTSDMFIIQDETLNAHDYILPDPTILKEFNEKSYPILIRLKPTSDISDVEGQSVKITARPTVGIAKWHSKYCPVGTITYQFKRDDDSSRIRDVFQNMMNNINRNRLMKGVKEIDIVNIFDDDNNMISENKEVKKYWNSFQILDRDKIFQLDKDRTPKYYEYCVESLGQMQPIEIVYWGMYMLRLKLIDVVNRIETDYVKVDKAKSVMDAIDIEIVNENHTIGCLVSNYIKKHKDVTFATYKMPHPLDERIFIRVKLLEDSKTTLSNKERTITIFRETIDNIINTLTEMMSEWTSLTEDKLKGGIGFSNYILDTDTNEYFAKKMTETTVKETAPKKTKKKSKKIKMRML